MKHVLAAAALLGTLAFAGAAMADCGAAHTAQSASTVTAQGGQSTPVTPAPQTPQSGG